MAAVEAERETIPRLHQLVPHLRDFLLRMRGGELTFEAVRLGYAETVARLAVEGRGRQTASRVSDSDAYWSPTVEVLNEAMRLGFVERQPLPSARRHLDSYRDRSYRLTDGGREAADVAGRDGPRFTTLIAEAAIAAHPYLRGLLLLLGDDPLVCPEIREGDLETARAQGQGTDHWAAWAAERINAHADTALATPAAVKSEMAQTVTKRFGTRPVRPPTNKALAEALNDAFAIASLRARGLPVGATDLKVLKAWGSQLLLLDQSRYVPGFEDTNVIWLASDLDRADGRLVATRRTFVERGRAVAKETVAAYRRQARSRITELITMPYLPIHEVRAEAAFNCRVTRALVDLVLERLASGEFEELGVQVWLHLSGEEVPTSEPVYRRGGTRRFSITMATTAGKDNA